MKTPPTTMISLHNSFPAFVALFAITSVLSACSSIGPDYKAPMVDAPAGWADHHGGSSALEAAATSSAALPADRWAVFGDAELTRLQSLARQSNQDAKIAALRIRQSRTAETTVSAQRGLQVGVGGGVSRQRQSETGANEHFVNAIGGGAGSASQQPLLDALASPFTLYRADFDASWEPDLWGRVQRAEEAAKASTEGQAATLRQVQLSVVAEVARTYFFLRATQRQELLAKEQLAAAVETEALLKAQRDSGMVDDSAVIRQRSQVAAIDARIPALLSQEAQAMNRLTRLCGAAPGALNDELSAARMGDKAPALPDLRLGLPSELAHRRPDIAAAESRLHAATASIGIATADLYPRITLGASFGFESVDSDRIGEWGSRQWSVGPSLTIPLFDQGRRRSTINLRELQQQEAAVAYQQTVLKAWHETDDAISSYVAETKRELKMADNVRNTKEQEQLARARFEHGLTDYVPVMIAVNALLEAQQEFELSTAKVNISLVAIYKALGDDGI